ncbi:hypothetical protein HK102_008443 [Quaeritorhiza haematococci]|nr:hypothetical protein HK102_008443 [Quaeritorhiza haematococci]
MSSWYSFLSTVKKQSTSPRARRIANSIHELNLSVLSVMGDYDHRAHVTELLLWCPKIHTVNLYRCFWVKDNVVVKLAQACPNLVSVNLSYCDLITDETVIALAHSSPIVECAPEDQRSTCQLQCLILRECSRITDKSLEALALSRAPLQRINLAHCNITDAGLAAFARAVGSTLQHVVLHKCATITDDGIIAIAKAAGPRLRSIKFSMCRKVTDVAIEVLSVWCPNLRSVDMEGCINVTWGAIEGLLKRGVDVRYDWQMAEIKLVASDMEVEAASEANGGLALGTAFADDPAESVDSDASEESDISMEMMTIDAGLGGSNSSTADDSENDGTSEWETSRKASKQRDVASSESPMPFSPDSGVRNNDFWEEPRHRMQQLRADLDAGVSSKSQDLLFAYTPPSSSFEPSLFPYYRASHDYQNPDLFWLYTEAALTNRNNRPNHPWERHNLGRQSIRAQNPGVCQQRKPNPASDPGEASESSTSGILNHNFEGFVLPSWGMDLYSTQMHDTNTSSDIPAPDPFSFCKCSPRASSCSSSPLKLSEALSSGLLSSLMHSENDRLDASAASAAENSSGLFTMDRETFASSGIFGGGAGSVMSPRQKKAESNSRSFGESDDASESSS